MTITFLRKLPSFWLVTFFILQVSCTVTREYPFMNRSCMHCDSFPVYYADKYDQLVFMQKFQDVGNIAITWPPLRRMGNGDLWIEMGIL